MDEAQSWSICTQAILRAIHFAHSACAEQSDNFVRTEFGTRAEGHSCAALVPQKKRVAADAVLLDK